MTNETTYTKTILNDQNPQCVILDMDSTLSSPEGENFTLVHSANLGYGDVRFVNDG